MKPYVAAARAGIHVNTVRTWTLEDFKRFFSVSAQGGNKRVRDISDDDLRVLVYIKELKRKGLNTREVVASLIEAQRHGFDKLPLPQNAENIVPMAVIPRQAADEVILAERRIMAEKITALEERIEGLEQRLANEKIEREQLIRELAEVRTELRLYKEGWRPSGN